MDVSWHRWAHEKKGLERRLNERYRVGLGRTSSSPDNASGRRETKQDDHLSGNSRLRRVSMDSVRSVLDEHRKTSLASLSMSAKTARRRSTDRQRSGAAKSRSMGGKNRGRGTSNSIGFMVAEEEEMRAASCSQNNARRRVGVGAEGRTREGV